MTDSSLAKMRGEQIRRLCRDGTFSGPTAGVARGFAQANLVILPEESARDFRRFCELNPKPCPLIEVTEPGVFEPRESAPAADLRTDLPRYRVYRDGVCTDRPTSIASHCEQASSTGEGPLVSFLIGCSFTFESSLLAAGIPVRHIEEKCNVSMYRTNVACRSAGAFDAPLVVSMRPMTPQQADLARRITQPLSNTHGGPIQIGNADAIGIHDLAQADYGDPVTIHPDEIPVFWACGVTPIEAILRAKPPVALTHEPGHMFVTDLSVDA